MQIAALKDAEAWTLTAGALKQAYGLRQLSPVEAVNSVLRRLDAVNPGLNAVVTQDRDRAIAAALCSEQRWRAGRPLSPLDGVPFTVKDNIPAAGLLATFGSRLYADYVPEQDELPVARLRAAGAILIGKTNIPELALQGYTGNALFGVTRNPWDPGLTPGGSSGGAVAAVSAGIAPLAIATDGGGSIRRPCAHTGCVGLKPSTGRVPRSAGFPSFLHDFEVVGPIARTVSDLVLAMQSIAAADATDYRSRQFRASPFRVPQAIPRARILVMTTLGEAPVDPEVRRGTLQAADTLARLGHAVDTGSAGMLADLTAAIESVNAMVWPVISQAGLAWLMERHFAHRSSELTPALAQMQLAGQALRATDYQQALDCIDRVRNQMQQLFEKTDCLLLPSAAALPWAAANSHPDHIDGMPAGPRGHAIFTAFANAAGLPALALPGPMSAAGLPVGFQLVGPHGADGWLCALGQQYEKAAAWPMLWSARQD